MLNVWALGDGSRWWVLVLTHFRVSMVTVGQWPGAVSASQTHTTQLVAHTLNQLAARHLWRSLPLFLPQYLPPSVSQMFQHLHINPQCLSLLSLCFLFFSVKIDPQSRKTLVIGPRWCDGSLLRPVWGKDGVSTLEVVDDANYSMDQHFDIMSAFMVMTWCFQVLFSLLSKYINIK